MKSTIIGVLALLYLIAFIPCSLFAIKINYNQTKNEIELVHEFDVNDASMRHDGGLLYNTTVFNPVSSNDKVKFIISSPRTVYVGQNFTIYFSIHPETKINIPFWADLIPDSLQASAQGLKYISHSVPTMGDFDQSEHSVAHKGGKGQWKFNGIMNARNVVHMSVTLQAMSAGRKKYTTMIATNPPALLSLSIDSTKELPIALSDTAKGLQNKPLIISVLDNDYGMSALKVVNVVEGQHGKVAINNDNTLIYMPEKDFVGTDQFSYMVQDAAGNCAQADVMVMIAECPAPQIIR